MTHTYVILSLSLPAWDEIADKLSAAGYGYAFHQETDGVVIDMHGIAVCADRTDTRPQKKESTDTRPQKKESTDA